MEQSLHVRAGPRRHSRLGCSRKDYHLVQEYKLKLGEIVTTIPTIGFNVESVQYKSLSFTVWDVGGQVKLRHLWRHYYHSTKVVIFAVDSNDKDRLWEAGAELQNVVCSDELRDVPLLIFANKQDLPYAMPTPEIAKGIGLDSYNGRKWCIQACTATAGDGLYEGLDWLAKELTSRRTLF